MWGAEIFRLIQTCLSYYHATKRISWTNTLALAQRWLPPPRMCHPFPDARFTATIQDKKPDALVRLPAWVLRDRYPYHDPRPVMLAFELKYRMAETTASTTRTQWMKISAQVDVAAPADAVQFLPPT